VLNLTRAKDRALDLGERLTGAVVTFVVLLLVIQVGSHIGAGTQAIITRFMGLIVTAMGMQFALTGLKAFMQT
jgi:small neutral amino acid transporter SnatA (MarC family)